MYFSKVVLSVETNAHLPTVSLVVEVPPINAKLLLPKDVNIGECDKSIVSVLFRVGPLVVSV